MAIHGTPTTAPSAATAHSFATTGITHTTIRCCCRACRTSPRSWISRQWPRPPWLAGWRWPATPRRRSYTSQAQFLLGNDIQGYLAGLDALPFAERLKRVGAVKTLMLPGQMGERFQVMALSRGLDEDDVAGFDADLRYQLRPRP